MISPAVAILFALLPLVGVVLGATLAFRLAKGQSPLPSVGAAVKVLKGEKQEPKPEEPQPRKFPTVRG